MNEIKVGSKVLIQLSAWPGKDFGSIDKTRRYRVVEIIDNTNFKYVVDLEKNVVKGTSYYRFYEWELIP